MKNNKIKSELIKKGTAEWWVFVGTIKAAENRRKRYGLDKKASIYMQVGEIDDYLKGLSLLKRFWLILTIGDLHPVNNIELCYILGIIDRYGITHKLFVEEPEER